MKSWLAQGSSGRWETLLPGTTFLHIYGALRKHTFAEQETWAVIEFKDTREFNFGFKLRTVPTKYKGVCPRLGTHGKK